MISKFRNCFVYDGKNADIGSLNHSQIQFLMSLFSKLAKMQLKAVSGNW